MSDTVRITCSSYICPECTNGYCPSALYYDCLDKYGDSLGYTEVSCEECCYNTHTCDNCIFQSDQGECRLKLDEISL
jgi:hypothetical protein